MGKVNIKTKSMAVTVKGKKEEVWALTNNQYDEFNPGLLGLGDISNPSESLEAIAAVFDLSGFTMFCSQIDPHLAVPEFLSRFLDWLFDKIKKRFLRESYPEGKTMWSELPFLGKFLGDGVLFLWNTHGMDINEINNVVAMLHDICEDYLKGFYPKIKTDVVDPPTELRCGIARGMVYSVGNGQDYVGPCINIASRLHKINGLRFCFSRRGFNVSRMDESYGKNFLEKRIIIDGIGENELIWIRKTEFDKLSDEEKKQFRNP